MPKKYSLRKSRRKLRSSASEIPTVAVFVIFVSVLLLVFGVKYWNQEPTRVLGLTSQLLAKGGDDGSNDDSSSGKAETGSSNSGSGSRSEDSADDNNSGSSGSSDSQKSSDSSSDQDELEDEDELEFEIEEVEVPENERIRVRSKDGRTRVDITAGGVKTRLEVRDDRVIIKAENEDGSETELEDNAFLKIDDRLAKNQIKVATVSGDRFILERGAVGAVTTLPISIDLATNQLIVNTPAGQKVLAVLPDQAIQNLIAANTISRLVKSDQLTEIGNSRLNLTEIITLGEKNSIPIYEIAGVSDQKLLGFIPVAIPKTVEVAVTTGAVLETQMTLLNQVVDALAF